ncbi:MAG: DUF2085 domain-containing protein [Anaerolineae bacterium]
MSRHALRPPSWDRRVERMAEVLARLMVHHWAAVLAAAFSLLLAGVFLAPLSQSVGWDRPARLLYAAGSLACHQRPERSLFLFGFPGAVCARDTGILAGLAGAAWVWTLVYRRRGAGFCPWWYLGLAALPAAVDGGMQLLGLWESTNLLRLGTGMLLGGGVTFYIFPHLERGFERGASPIPLAPFLPATGREGVPARSRREERRHDRGP